jgi:PleD family two-component response regulator
MTVSIGVVIAGAARDVDMLLKRADAAMYAAKDNGRNQTRLARV